MNSECRFSVAKRLIGDLGEGQAWLFSENPGVSKGTGMLVMRSGDSKELLKELTKQYK